MRSGTVAYQTGNGPIGFGHIKIGAGEVDATDSLFCNALDWTGGTIRGANTNDVTAGSLAISGESSKTLVDMRLFNGVGAVSSISGTGDVELSNASLLNLANATINVTGDLRLVNIDAPNTRSVIVNNGTFAKTGGTGVTNLVDVQFENNATVSVQTGTLRLGGGGTHSGAFTISAGTTLELDQTTINSVDVPHVFLATSSITGAPGSTLDVTGGVSYGGTAPLAVGNLRIGPTANSASSNGRGTSTPLHQLALAAGAHAVLRVHDHTVIDTANGARLDLNDNAAIFDDSTSSPLATIRSLIISGYASGNWTGAGISSSLANSSTHGVGYAQASAVFTNFPATFAGQQVAATASLVRYTRYGDADLNGVVNLLDFNRLAANFNGTNKVWSQGDFNYDGNVNLLDFNKLAANFNMSLSSDPTPGDWAALAGVVPEPGTGLAEFAGVLGIVLARVRHARRSFRRGCS